VRADSPGSELPVLAVDLGPGVRAGFTTRAGGVSDPPWHLLNLSLGVDDDPVHVLTNRDLVEQWVGAPVAYASQVHGCDACVVSGPPDPSAMSVGRYDALVSTSASVAVAVLSADCVPVLLADADAGVVGAVHAGRRGLAVGVVEAAIAALVRTGAEPSRVRAVVGPAISGAAYEVPAALRDEIAAVLPETWSTTAWGTPALDLPAGVVAALGRTGVTQVEVLDICTFTDERFYSHRRAQRAGTTTGRFAGVVRLST
jgi:YfiH family protein